MVLISITVVPLSLFSSLSLHIETGNSLTKIDQFSFVLLVLQFCYMHCWNEHDHRDIHSTSGKIKRAMLQFTPGSWTHVRWLDPTCTYMRFFALCQMVIFWQVSELNTFFLKHIFEMPPSHPLVVARLILIGVIVAPSVRWVYVV